MRKGVPSSLLVIVLLALLLIVAVGGLRTEHGDGPYRYPYLMLDPDDQPLRISLDASRRLFEGEVFAHEVRSATYTNSWPEGFRGWGRGLEAPGFPTTQLTRGEIEQLLSVLLHDLFPVPAEDSEQDGFMNSNANVIVRLEDGAKALLSIGRGTPPNILVSSTQMSARYNTSARSLFTQLRARARVAPDIPLLFPHLDAAAEDAKATDRLGPAYLDVKQFVATHDEFRLVLGQLDSVRVARGRNFIDPDADPVTAVVTFAVQGEQGRGVIQAMAYRDNIRAELIVTEHHTSATVGTFITATGPRPARPE